jgi:hypothetical protein
VQLTKIDVRSSFGLSKVLAKAENRMTLFSE